MDSSRLQNLNPFLDSACLETVYIVSLHQSHTLPFFSWTSLSYKIPIKNKSSPPKLCLLCLSMLKLCFMPLLLTFACIEITWDLAKMRILTLVCVTPMSLVHR